MCFLLNLDHYSPPFSFSLSIFNHAIIIIIIFIFIFSPNYNIINHVSFPLLAVIPPSLHRLLLHIFRRSDLPLPCSNLIRFRRNMFGGVNSNPMLPLFLEENQLQYNANTSSQLQLFGDVGCSVGPSNYMGNEQTTTVGPPTKRIRQDDAPLPRQQKRHVPLSHSVRPDEACHQPGIVLNPNTVSTGLRLSCEDEERNSSITSACEYTSGVSAVMLSLADNLKVEIERQKDEFERNVRLQEDNIIKGVRELKHRHMHSFLSTLEKGVARKLREKELEIENTNRKNKELTERMKQMGMEVQSWQYRAKYNESVINMLRNNLKQVMEQSAMNGKEGCGDSEVDDAASYTNFNHMDVGGVFGNSDFMKEPINCRSCMVREVSMLLLPCRHLCLCKDCEGYIVVCPVCQVMKTASVQVYLS